MEPKLGLQITVHLKREQQKKSYILSDGFCSHLCYGHCLFRSGGSCNLCSFTTTLVVQKYLDATISITFLCVLLWGHAWIRSKLKPGHGNKGGLRVKSGYNQLQKVKNHTKRGIIVFLTSQKTAVHMHFLCLRLSGFLFFFSVLTTHVRDRLFMSYCSSTIPHTLCLWRNVTLLPFILK